MRLYHLLFALAIMTAGAQLGMMLRIDAIKTERDAWQWRYEQAEATVGQLSEKIGQLEKERDNVNDTANAFLVIIERLQAELAEALEAQALTEQP